MSIAFQFKLTVAGQAALFNASRTGTSLNLTHIQFGSGNRAPTGAETALLNPQQLAPIANGLTVSPSQIRMSAIFSGDQNYVIREAGLWAGSPGSTGAILVAYWSQATGDLAVKSPGVDFVFSHDMSIDSTVPGANLTIVADTAQAPLLALLAEHERKPDPHPQYAHTDLSNVRDATITPGKLSKGAPIWTAEGSLSISGRTSIAGGRVLGLNFVASGESRIYRLATLPRSTNAFLQPMFVRPGDPLPGVPRQGSNHDQLRISGVYGGWPSASKSELEIVIASEGGLNVRFLRGRSRYGDIAVRIYAEQDGTATVYLAMTGYSTASIDLESLQTTLHADTPMLESAPTGELVWDSSTQAPLSYFDDAGKLVLSGVPVGAGAVGGVIFFARPSAPEGYLKANGAAISRTVYAALFSAIGTTFGVGDGSTTFNIPDLRSEFLRGIDDSRGLDRNRVFGSTQLDALQGHQHTYIYAASANVRAGSNGGTPFTQTAENTTAIVSDGVNGAPRIAPETRPRNVALLACIKY